MLRKSLPSVWTRFMGVGKKPICCKPKRFVPLLEPLEARWVPSITEYSVPNFKNDSGLAGITPGSDGNLWFTDWRHGQVGRMTTSGSATEWTLQYQFYSNVHDIAPGPTGNQNLYYAYIDETSGPPLATRFGKIVWNPPPVKITEYTPWGSSIIGVRSIAPGPDGNLWVTEFGVSKLGVVTPSAVLLHQYNASTNPGATNNPVDIVAGPDNNMWFTNDSDNSIGKMTTNGTLTEYTIPTASCHPYGIAVGPDGALWFCEDGANKIGRITTSGSISEYSIPVTNGGPINIVTGADGKLYFTESGSNVSYIGQLTTSGVFQFFGTPTANAFPTDITLGSDNNIWFTEFQINKIGKLTVGSAPAAFQAASLINALNAGSSSSSLQYSPPSPVDKPGLSSSSPMAITDELPSVPPHQTQHGNAMSNHVAARVNQAHSADVWSLDQGFAWA